MEKASTPSTNRLTRSAAKNTPRKLDQEDSLDHSTAEDIKHNLRKSSRKVEMKPKTNGENSNSLDSRKLKPVEEINDGNSVDGCHSDDSNISNKHSSPLPENNKPSPVISRRSLRARRSITPGPELNSSAMKRSTSEGKLSTPNTRRTSRAKSESKDFVFTPSKTKSNDSEASNSTAESNGKHIRRKSTLRVIDKIVEEESNSDELEQHDPKRKSMVDSASKSNSPKTKRLSDVTAHYEQNSLLLNSSDILNEPLSNKSPLSRINESNTEEEMHLEISEPFEEVSVSIAPEKCNESKISHLADGPECESEMETCKSTANNSLVQNSVLQKPQESVIQLDDGNTDTCEETEINIVNKSSDLSKDNIEPDKSGHIQDQSLILDESGSETGKVESVSENTRVEKTVPEPNDKPKLPLTKEMDHNDKPGKTDSPKKVSEATTVVDETSTTVVSENNNIDSMIVIEETEDVDEPICEASTETVSPLLVRNEPSFEEGKALENTVTPIDNKSLTISNISSDKQNNDSKLSGIENEECFISDERTVLATTCLEKHAENSYEHITSSEIYTSKRHSIVSASEKNEDIEAAVMIEDSNSTGSAGKDMGENLTSQEEIFIQEVEEESIEKTDLNTIVEPLHDIDEIAQPSTTVSVENTAVEDKSMSMQESEKLEMIIEDGRKELTQNNNDSVITESCEQNRSLEQDIVKLPVTNEMYGIDFYEDKTAIVEDENSGSDSDIYKGLSDCDGGEKQKDKEGIQLDETVSSEPRSGDSGEEYTSSEDGEYEEEEDEEEEEEEEDEEEDNEEEDNVKEETATGRDNTLIKDEKNIQTGTGSENPSGADSPMTYDKALAILNENREKKIDDEEFFDMFTQELNRVSDESESDSDIAIVDEYIMDPEEEEAKKLSPNKKGNLHSNVKQLQRPAPPPSVPPSQSFSMPDQYAAAYSQQNPPVSRMNFAHGGMYNPYGQGMPAMHDGRGALLYEQYATGIPDPRVFDPLEANYSGAQMFSNTLEPQMRFSGGHPLKVRSILAMNSSQPPNTMNVNYAGPSQSATSLEIGHNDNAGNSDRLGPLKVAEDVKEEGGSQSSLASRESEEVASSPILELLGLDREKLRLLKQVLGLSNKANRPVENEERRLKKKLKAINVSKRLMKTRHRAKKGKQHRRKEIAKQIINSTFKTSRKHSSGETAASSRPSHCALYKTSKPESENSSAETVKSKTREVSLEDGSVSVTINTRQRRKTRNRVRGKRQKRARSTSSDSSGADSEFMRKCKWAMKNSSESDSNIKPRKMIQKKVQKKKSPHKSHILKSKSGTFTVDPLTSASQSSDADSLVASPSMFLDELRRSVKSDAASGKNRLSNLFSQHSPQKARASKSSDGGVSNSKRKQKAKKSQKLSADFLEKLTKDERKPKRELSESGSEEVNEKPPRKMRKRSVKVKSTLAEQHYIPLVTGGGATQFSLARLDRYNTLSAAEQVAQLRAAHLYGANVQRITILDFKG